ncbi:MAG: hypothetical protein K2L22_07235 [Muribaculaceae bacterium]|nr:hypothetical protein [Muribaculaceae bacterium]
MKKIFTLALSIAATASLSAESIKIFKCTEDGIPGQTEPELMGFSISANGQYICGTIQAGAGGFSADTQSGIVNWMMADEVGGEFRGINNEGLAIGFLDDDGVKVPFGTLEAQVLKAPSGVRSILGESLSDDGDVMVGSFTEDSFNVIAAYSANGSDWKKLPMPSDAELGNLKEHLNDMSAAKFVSGDGKVILGHLGSFTFPVIWILNEAGEYEPDFFPARYVKGTDEDVTDDSKELLGMSAFYTCMSNNGKYVGALGTISDENFGLRVVPVIYNTEEKTLKIYKEPQEIDYLNLGLYPRAIADDGTFIGMIGVSLIDGSGCFIMRAGEETAELFVDAFPAYAETFGACDEVGYSVPTGISADGKKILCYTFYSDDLYGGDDPAYYVTYVIDTDANGVEEIKSAYDQQMHDAVYSIDGRKLQGITKGINIVRNSDGSVKKILK